MTKTKCTCADCENHLRTDEFSRCECGLGLVRCHARRYCTEWNAEPHDAKECAGFNRKEGVGVSG